MSVGRATLLFHSCGVGFVMTQILVPQAIRDRDTPPLTGAEHTLLTQWLTELADQDDGVTPATDVPLLNS
jgi:hypothetical protein